MDDISLKKLTTEEKVTILEKEIARVEGRIGEFLKLLVNHYPQGLTRTEIKALLRRSTRKQVSHRDSVPTRRTMLSLDKRVVRGLSK